MDWSIYLDNNQNRFIDALADFIAIPSVSAQDAHFEDVVRRLVGGDDLVVRPFLNALNVLMLGV